MSQPPASSTPTWRRDEEQASTIGAGAAPRALGGRRADGSALRLWLCGIGMLVPVFAFAWRYPLGPNSSTLTDIGKLAHYEPAEFAGYVGGMAMLFGLYILALRESRRLPARRVLPAIFGCGALMALGMDWMYPVNAIDIFLYAVRSRLFTTYGANPIGAFIKDFPADAWAAFSTREWASHVSPYGPLWNLIAAPITALAGDRMIVALVGFKLLAVVCQLAGGWVIVRALTAAGRGDAATGALFYLWNPLVLWEGLGNGHNDVLLALPLLLALLAWFRRRDGLVIPLLVVATLIKYVTAPLILLAAIALWRRAESAAQRRRLVGWSVALSAIAVVIGLYPFYDLQAIRASVAEQGTIFYTSPAAMLIALLHERYPVELIRPWIMLLSAGVFLIVLGWQAGVLWQRPERLPRACFEAVYVFLLVAVWNVRPWYLVWPVGLAALLPWGWPAWRMIAWTAGGLAGYALFIWIEAWWQPGYDTMQIVGVPLMLGATLALTCAEIIRRGVFRRAIAALSPRRPLPMGEGESRQRRG